MVNHRVARLTFRPGRESSGSATPRHATVNSHPDISAALGWWIEFTQGYWVSLVRLTQMGPRPNRLSQPPLRGRGSVLAPALIAQRTIFLQAVHATVRRLLSAKAGGPLSGRLPASSINAGNWPTICGRRLPGGRTAMQPAADTASYGLAASHFLPSAGPTSVQPKPTDVGHEDDCALPFQGSAQLDQPVYRIASGANRRIRCQLAHGMQNRTRKLIFRPRFVVLIRNFTASEPDSPAR